MIFAYRRSATETKVPARGKTLVPTDLSISIPEGTYARVGNVNSLHSAGCSITFFSILFSNI